MVVKNGVVDMIWTEVVVVEGGVVRYLGVMYVGKTAWVRKVGRQMS